MDAATAWLAVAADVLAEPDPVRARQTLTDALIARTDAGLVSRIALSHADPDGIDIAVVGEIFHPGPDLLRRPLRCEDTPSRGITVPPATPHPC